MLEGTLARQARGDHEASRKQAQPVASGLAQKTMATVGNLFARAPSPTPQEEWEKQQREAKSPERQRDKKNEEQ